MDIAEIDFHRVLRKNPTKMARPRYSKFVCCTLEFLILWRA